MTENFENRMVCDLWWGESEYREPIREKLGGPGYRNGSGVFVPEEDAYEYAVGRVDDDPDLKEEFLDWFYSIGWTKEG